MGAGVPPDEYDALQPLLKVLGAELAGTRKVTDKGWLPRARQVGITGHSVAPALYVALGVQGKFNHVIGTRSAGTVVAVNLDRKCPDLRLGGHRDRCRLATSGAGAGGGAGELPRLDPRSGRLGPTARTPTAQKLKSLFGLTTISPMCVPGRRVTAKTTASATSPGVHRCSGRLD